MDNFKKFPYQIEEDQSTLDEKWALIKSVKVVCGSTLPVYRAAKEYARFAETLYNFKVRSDDIWVVSFPRSGTTMSQEMVWMIINDDYETAKKEPLIKRFPYLEMNTGLSENILEEAKRKVSGDKEKLEKYLEVMSPQWETLAKATNRRFIKSHMPFALLPPNLLTSGCKVLYLARNPKDVAVSFFKFFYHNASDKDFPEFWKLFRDGRLIFGSYWDHLRQGWEKRGNPNFYFLFYEDMVKDLKGTIKKVSSFLEKDMTEGQIEKLADHLNIKNFRNNKSVTRIYMYYWLGSDGRDIIRKGKTGGWREYFTPDLNSDANSWIKENYNTTDLRFPLNVLE